MPVPVNISELSQTAGSNYPQGTDSPSTLDDVQRAIASFIALLRDSKGLTSVKTIASAGTVDIGGADSYAVEITGTTAITSFGTNYSGPRHIRFTGVLTLTHNASLLNLPGAASITTAAGDSCVAVPNSTGNGWHVTSYQRAATAPDFATNASVAAAIAALILVPPGTVMHTAASTAPSGYIKANGGAVSRTTYAALFGAIGTIYGAGDGSTTFNVPDLRGEFIRGWDDSRGLDAGRSFGSVQLGSVESHSHAPPAGLTGPWLSNSLGGVDGEIDGSEHVTSTDRHGVAGNTQAFGGSETRPRNVALLVCIKY